MVANLRVKSMNRAKEMVVGSISNLLASSMRAISWMINTMEKAELFSITENNMKVNTEIVSFTVLAYRFVQVRTNTKDSFSWANHMPMENTHTQMVIITKGNFTMISSMVMELLLLQTEINMKGHLWITRCMASLM